MCSSFRVKDHFPTFDDWNEVWHKMWKRKHPNWAETMYVDGQFDELPYIIWEDNELIEEFYYHDELVEYDKTKRGLLS